MVYCVKNIIWQYWSSRHQPGRCGLEANQSFNRQWPWSFCHVSVTLRICSHSWKELWEKGLHLHQLCQEEWAKFPANYCYKLVQGFPKHLTLTIESEHNVFCRSNSNYHESHKKTCEWLTNASLNETCHRLCFSSFVNVLSAGCDVFRDVWAYSVLSGLFC